MGEERSIAAFFELWELYGDATLAGMMAGALLGVLGVYVVLQRQVFLAAAVSQTAGLGATLAFFLAAKVGAEGFLADPTLMSVIVTVAAVLLVSTGPAARSEHRDALLGIAFLVGSAGVLALGWYIPNDKADIEAAVFGSPLAIVPTDLHSLEALVLGLLGLHAWGWRGFAAVSFDREGARVRGLPVRTLELGLGVGLAVAIATCTRILGALPTFAFAVLPAFAAVRAASNVAWALVLAGLLGAASGFGGYLLSYLADLSVNAGHALSALLVAAAVEILRAVLSRVRVFPPFFPGGRDESMASQRVVVGVDDRVDGV